MDKFLTIYISGPMSGVPHHNFPAFNSATKILRDTEHVVINPAEVNPSPGTPWSDCMRNDIRELMICDTIVVLPGWEKSRGATLEVHIGRELGMNVFTLEDFLDEYVS